MLYEFKCFPASCPVLALEFNHNLSLGTLEIASFYRPKAQICASQDMTEKCPHDEWEYRSKMVNFTLIKGIHKAL